MVDALTSSMSSRSIVGAAAPGAGLVVLNLSLDGAVAAAALAIGAGISLSIERLIASANLATAAPCLFELQQSNDGGATFFTIARCVVGTVGTVTMDVNRLIQGSALTQIRVRVNPAGAGEVGVSMSAHSAPANQ